MRTVIQGQQMEQAYHQLMEHSNIAKEVVNQEVIREELLGVTNRSHSQASNSSRIKVNICILIISSISRIHSSSLMQATLIHLQVLKMVSHSVMVEVALFLVEANRHHKFTSSLRSSNS